MPVVEHFDVENEEYHIEPVLSDTIASGDMRAPTGDAVYQAVQTLVTQLENLKQNKTMAVPVFIGGQLKTNIEEAVRALSANSLDVPLENSAKFFTAGGAYADKETVPAEGSTKNFTSGAAFEFFAKSSTPESWLGKVFGPRMGRTWKRGYSMYPGFALSGYATVFRFENGIYVAGTSAIGCFWSEDGKNWVQCTGFTGSEEVYSVEYKNDIWVSSTSSGIYWSEDGKSWTSGLQYSARGGIPLRYADGLWLAGLTTSMQSGDGLLVWSEDGKTWNTPASIPASIAPSVLEYADGIWVCSGYHYDFSDSQDMTFWSVDGKTWTQGTGIGTNAVSKLRYANGIWAMGTYAAGLWWSEDGKTWSQNSSSTIHITALEYANGIWVAGTYAAGCWWSTNGKSWTQGTGNTGVRITSVYYANGLWVSCRSTGTPGCWWSEDGKAWTQGSGISSPVESVFYANGIWIAATGTAGLWWSKDGKAWTKSVMDDVSVYYVVYMNGLWLAGGETACIWYSSVDELELTD